MFPLRFAINKLFPSQRMNVGRRRWPGTSDLQRRAYANVRVCVCVCVCLCVCVCARYRQPGGKRITPIRVLLVPMFGIVKRSLKDVVEIYGQNCTRKEAKSVGAEVQQKLSNMDLWDDRLYFSPGEVPK